MSILFFYSFNIHFARNLNFKYFVIFAASAHLGHYLGIYAVIAGGVAAFALIGKKIKK